MFDTMMTRDIRQILDTFRRSVDQFFSDFNNAPGFSTTWTRSGDYAFSPAVESHWTDDQLLLRAILPGVSEKDVKVTVQNERLILEGERKAPKGWTDGAYTQLVYGKFYAAIPLPSGLNLDKVSCHLHDGVLDIEVPVAEQMKPRQIPVAVSQPQHAIAA
jgi:HSP20 family protein